MSAQKSAGSGGNMKDYGLTVHPHGVVWHSDRRMRVWSKDGVLEAFRPKVVGRRRQRVQSFSKTSQRRLAMVAANVGGQFRSHLTLTYHGLTVAGEDEAARNQRIAVRAKRDLNRFLTSMRPYWRCTLRESSMAWKRCSKRWIVALALGKATDCQQLIGRPTWRTAPL